MIQAGRTDRLRFWRSYLLARRGRFLRGLANPISESRRNSQAWNSSLEFHTSEFQFRISNLTRALEKQSWRSTLRLWRARETRYLTWNRAFEPVNSGVARGHIIRDLDRPALLELFADPDAPFRRPDVKVLKDSPSSTVMEFDMPLNGVAHRVVYKRFRVKSWIDPITAWFRRPAALRSWIFGQGLRECGLPTPRPLAVLFRRRCGLSFEGYLLTEKIDNVRELHRFVADLDELPSHDRQQTLRGSIDQVARLVRDLHSRRLSHRDLKAANILVASGQWPVARGQGTAAPSSILDPPSSILHPPLATNHWPLATSKVWLIDLVGVKRHRRLSWRRRVQNLARLHASFIHSSALTRTDKLRFLRTYLQWGLFGQDGWKRYWREIDIATKAKIARNTRRRRPLG